MLALERRHDSEIEVDASDMLWLLLGKAMHKILEMGDHSGVIIESRLQVNFGGIIVSAKPDLYHIEDKSIDDYKVTSVFSFLLGDKIEWEQQLNINALVYQDNGLPVEKLRIYAILRDHIKSKAKADPDYPAIPFIVKELPLWHHIEIRDFIASRIVHHETHKETPSDFLPPCTDSERWVRPSQWAVMKAGNKKATKLFDTELEASVYIEQDIPKDKDKYTVVERKGEPVRCLGYCNAAPFCDQIKKELTNG
jgi:hypothetical protein